MPSIDVREFEEAEQIKAWLKAGEAIEIWDDEGVVVARIVPVPNETPDTSIGPDSDVKD